MFEMVITTIDCFCDENGKSLNKVFMLINTNHGDCEGNLVELN